MSPTPRQCTECRTRPAREEKWTCDQACEAVRKDRRSVRTRPEPAARAYARINTTEMADELPTRAAYTIPLSYSNRLAALGAQSWYERRPFLAGMLVGAAWVALLWLGAEMRVSP